MYDLSLVPNIVDDEAGIISVTRTEDNYIQTRMVDEHKWFLGTRLKRDPTILEAFQSWMSEGLAEKYRRHVMVEQRNYDDLISFTMY